MLSQGSSSWLQEFPVLRLVPRFFFGASALASANWGAGGFAAAAGAGGTTGADAAAGAVADAGATLSCAATGVHSAASNTNPIS